MQKHLNPLGINSFYINYLKATLNHTLSVPQFKTSNSWPWNLFQRRIANYAMCTCGPKGGTLYLMTSRSENGLITVNGEPIQDLSNKEPVTYCKNKFVQNTAWTAGCCVWTNLNTKKEKAESFPVWVTVRRIKRCCTRMKWTPLTYRSFWRHHPLKWSCSQEILNVLRTM